MAFTNQFTLSLELSRIVPLSLVASKAAEAVMNLARSLQSSGSDIVIEEDLAYIFGRCRIARQFESSFKTLLKASAATTPLVGGIYLQSGPGPTIGRSLQHTAYFATVVQLSLLGWVHDNHELAQAITTAMERRMEGCTAEHEFRAIPSIEGIAGVIEACEE